MRKPNTNIKWAYGDGVIRINPLKSRKEAGFTEGNKKTSQELNWWMHETAKWIDYLEKSQAENQRRLSMADEKIAKLSGDLKKTEARLNRRRQKIRKYADQNHQNIVSLVKLMSRFEHLQPIKRALFFWVYFKDFNRREIQDIKNTPNFFNRGENR